MTPSDKFSRFLFWSLLLLSFPGFSQQPAEKPAVPHDPSRQFRIVFYNVENLFDTIDDKHHNDNEFLPGRKKNWTKSRYQKKLKNISRVLVAIDSVDLPAIVGFAEVENKEVLKELVTSTRLKKGNYDVILEEGADPRGIDVALIYRKDKVHCLNYKAFPASDENRTRSILYAKMTGPGGDTLHIFVNHWKAREGNKPEETEEKRMENARKLRHLVDSIFYLTPQPNIFIVGDFNDEPANRSMGQVLRAGMVHDKVNPRLLYNIMSGYQIKKEGTIYDNRWYVFDQVIVSGTLITKKEKGLWLAPPYAYIFKPDWMLKENKDKVKVPYRTYQGDNYQPGYSDHLPVFSIISY
jgi:predicted extracellular nuclease